MPKHRPKTSAPRQRPVNPLQRQLLKLNQNNTLDLKKQRAEHSVSLIYRPEEAASQTLPAIFETCQNGFKELCKLDSRFHEFLYSLFSTDSVEIERNSMLGLGQKRLDEQLENFISLVGPSLQLAPAQMAMEWLVRRFGIHKHNAQHLLLTSLPYHDSSLFATILSIIPCDTIPAAFRFLRQLQQSPQPFQRSFLVQQCLRVPAILRSINNYVLKLARADLHTEGLLRFWTDIYTQVLHAALESSDPKWQGQDGSNSSKIVDYMYDVAVDVLQMEDMKSPLGKNTTRLGPWCYPMLTILAAKGFPVKDKVKAFVGFVRKTMDHGTDDDAEAGLKICALLSRLDHHFCFDAATLGIDVPIKKRLLGRLDRIHEEVDISSFALSLCYSAVQLIGPKPQMSPSCMKKLGWWLDLDVLEEIEVESFMKTFLLRLQWYEQKKPGPQGLEAADFQARRRESMCTLICHWASDDNLRHPLTRALEFVQQAETQFRIDLLPLRARGPLKDLKLSAGHVVGDKNKTEDSEVELQYKMDLVPVDTISQPPVEPTSTTTSPTINKTEQKQLVSESIRTQDSSRASSQDSLPGSISYVPKVKGSFLTEQPPSSFYPLLSILLKVSNARGDAAQLRNYAEFKDIDAIILMSFFVRALSRPQLVPHVRRSTLRALNSQLPLLASNEWDPQALIPCLLVALTDSDAGVREAASDCFSDMSAFYAIEGRRGNSSGRKLLSDHGFYGELASKPTTMPFSLVRRFMQEAILPHLAACKTSEEYICHAMELILNAKLTSTINGTTGAFPDDLLNFNMAQRSSVAAFLMSHAVASNLLPLQLRTMKLLERVEQSATQARTEFLLPKLEAWINLAEPEARKHAADNNMTMEDANHAYLQVATPQDDKSMTLLARLLKGDVGNGRPDLIVPAYERAGLVYKYFYLPLALLQGLVDIGAVNDSKGSDALLRRRKLARQVLQNVRASKEDLGALLSKLPTLVAVSSDDDAEQPNKRRKTLKGQKTINDYSTPETLNKFSIALDLVEASRSHDYTLLGILFRMLQQVLAYGSESHSSHDQLVLSLLRSLNRIADTLKTGLASGMIRSSLRSDCQMNLLVACVTESDNISVRNEALALTSKLAAWSPELVLESIIPIFTFVGTSTVRNADDYSVQLTTRIIETVIPPLALSIGRKKKNRRDMVASLVKLVDNFVMAWPDIPTQRRLKIFEHLVNTLGASDYLHVVVAMLMDHYSTDDLTRHLTCDLVATFEPLTQLAAIKQSLELVIDLFNPKALSPKLVYSDAVYDLSEKTRDQQVQAARSLLAALRMLMTRKSTRSRIARLLLSGANEKSDTIHMVRCVLGRSIIVIDTLKTQGTETLAAAAAVTSAAFQMLPVEHMVSYVSLTLQEPTNSDQIKHVALKALMGQLPRPTEASHSTISPLLGILEDLCATLQTADLPELHYLVMMCIEQLIGQYGRRDVQMSLKILNSIVGDSALSSKDLKLQIMATNLLTSAVDVLCEDFIPLVPTTLSRSFTNLENLSASSKRVEMRGSVFALLRALVNNVAYALSDVNLDGTLHLCFGMAQEEPLKKAPARKSFYKEMGAQLDMGRCLETIKRNLRFAIQQGPNACEDAVRFAGYAFKKNRATLTSNTDRIFDLVRSMWDIRRLAGSSEAMRNVFPNLKVNKVEEKVNKLVLRAIPKLTMESFGDTMSDMVSWVSQGLSDGDREGLYLRATSLFNFLSHFMGEFKGVTQYADDFLDLAVNSLKVDPADPQESNLLALVLATLRSSFMNDEEGFWSSSRRFQAITPPLMELLPKAIVLSQDNDDVRDKTYNAIAALALAAPAPERRAVINKATLLYLNDEDARIRFAGVQCQICLLEFCKESWLSFLPQLLPYIAALQEDDDEQVDKMTKRWIAQLGELKGENIASMLE